MSIFAPKYLATHPFDLDHVPDLDQRVAALAQWQANLRSGRVHRAKEEALQADFLNLIFGQVLGYDHQDAHLWYLEKEQKSSTDGTKADGALGYFRQLAGQRTADVRVVIELKDARADLDKPQNRAADRRTPVEQAFSYASKVGGRCRWVLVSNFVELRLYPATDQGQYESFDLGTLPNSRTELARFFRLLLREQLLAETGESPTDHLYRERQAQEREISENFYGEYKQARLDLLAHLREQNPAVPDLLLFNKAQKLLDRVVFVCFCEDKTIIPPLTFRGLLKAVREDKFNRSESRIYERVKGLFRAIDEGFPDAGINKFNGGLFAPDADLDNLRILDAILEPIIALEIYDFDSDLNVNILGHIFEQSIADIEELKAQLAAAAPGAALLLSPAPRPTGPKKASKRKKDGIFYTPEYITRYMVREAVGGWLHQRYQAAGIEALPELPAEELTPQGQPLAALPAARKGALTKLLTRHTEAWQQYRQALLDIRVLDPACGSGAFLNQVFDYLHQEGQRVNRELARLSGGQTNVFDLDKHILTHNLFGVDLNAESVEITRLSLWLKTANRYQPLTALDANIRTGNSLIHDPAVAGELAFDWNTEFPEIMGGGGFDVVIGNPPYTYRNAIGDAEKVFYKKVYKTTEGNFDLYKFFMELIATVAAKDSRATYIVPNTFLSAKSYTKLRQHLLDNFSLLELFDLGLDVFDGVTVESLIFSLQKTESKAATVVKIQRDRKRDIMDYEKEYSITLQSAEGFNTNVDDAIGQITAKMWLGSFPLKQVCYATVGINTGYIKDELTAPSKMDARYHRMLNGRDIGRYEVEWPGGWIIYDPVFVKAFGDRGRSLPPEKIFTNDKILVQRTRRGMKRKLVCYYDTEQYYNLNRVSNIILTDSAGSTSLKYVFALLNSELLDYYFNKVFNEYEVKPLHLSQLPIKDILPAAQQPFIDAADALLALTAQVQQQRQAFLMFLQVKLGLTAPSRKLQGWDALTWDAFAAELKKAKVVLTLAQEAEWLPLLQQRQQALRTLTAQAATQDRALDQLVYTLYGLTKSEIALVEE